MLLSLRGGQGAGSAETSRLLTELPPRPPSTAASSGAAVALSIFPAASFAQAASSEAGIKALFKKIFENVAQNSPQLASSLGLDKGLNAGLKSTLSSNIAARGLSDLKRNLCAITALQKTAPGTLSPSAQLNRDDGLRASSLPARS